MNREDRQVAAVVGIILIVTTISLVAVLYFFWQLIGPPLTQLLATVQTGVSVSQYNYNFAYPGYFGNSDQPRSSFKTAKPNNFSRNWNRQSAVQDFLTKPFYNFRYPGIGTTRSSPEAALVGVREQVMPDLILARLSSANAVYETDLRIEINSLEINAPVIAGYDSINAMTRGWWHYPNGNRIGSQTTILTCFRRYTFPREPISCWNLNDLAPGAEVVVYKAQDVRARYVVDRVESVPSDRLAIWDDSSANVLRIITNDPLGSTARRLVVTALPQE